MLGKEDFLVIHALVKRGVYLCDITRQLGVHRKTVSRALARGGAPVPYRRGRPSRLEPSRAQVDRLLAEGVWNATGIFRELQALGYGGGVSILRDSIRPKRALRPGRATVRFETAPGRQLQTDWGVAQTVLAGVPTEIHFLASTLGFSRRFFFWGTDAEDAEHTYEGLIRAFEWFGGVAAEVLVDNQKVAVLEHRRGAAPRFSARFLDLARHYGFVPRACRPARPQTKGKDERVVGYIKHHFFVRYRAFESWAPLNQLAEPWLRAEADSRVHGTVHEVWPSVSHGRHRRCGPGRPSATTPPTGSRARSAGTPMSTSAAAATASRPRSPASASRCGSRWRATWPSMTARGWSPSTPPGAPSTAG